MCTDCDEQQHTHNIPPSWYAFVELGPTITFYRCKTQDEARHVASSLKQYKPDGTGYSNSKMSWQDCLELAAEKNMRPVGPVVPPV